MGGRRPPDDPCTGKASPVRREAVSGDLVCVPPGVRTRAAAGQRRRLVARPAGRRRVPAGRLQAGVRGRGFTPGNAMEVWGHHPSDRSYGKSSRP